MPERWEIRLDAHGWWVVDARDDIQYACSDTEKAADYWRHILNTYERKIEKLKAAAALPKDDSVFEASIIGKCEECIGILEQGYGRKDGASPVLLVVNILRGIVKENKDA